MKPIRVLHVFGSLDAGGAESRTMDIYRHIDKNVIQFDFLIHTEKKCFFEDEVIKMGGRIFRVPRFGLRSILAYHKALHTFFKMHPEYKIVHGHILSTAFIYNKIAKKYDVPVRIAHSRSGNGTHLTFENMVKGLFKRLSRFYVTNKFAVSEVAAVSAFGKNSVSSGEVQILPNAIEAKKYIYNPEVRKKMRKDLNIDDKFVVGHIGRFHQVKNHNFIIDVFNEIKKINPRSMLLLVGDGELKSTIENKVKFFGLSDDVIFTGVRSDVSNILQAMDVLLFPSFYEGLPGVVLEAQASGLPCIISKNITNEVKITELVEFISLDKNAKYWAAGVLNYSENFKRENTYQKIVSAGFDIESVAKWYEDFYIDKIDLNNF